MFQSTQPDVEHLNAGPHHLLGARIDTLDPSDGLRKVFQSVTARHAGYCCVSNVHQCMLVRDDPAFAGVVNGADLVITDSRILHWAIARRYRLAPLPTLRGAELMLELCRLAAQSGYPIALIGGRDPGLLASLEQSLLDRFPKLQIVYRLSPPFEGMSPTEERTMQAEIAASGARLVFVGLGCPKQERWMARNARATGGFCIGVGAAFDFNSGHIRKSPAWIHAAGLEWAFRLASEPRRLWRRYLVASPRFLFAYWFGA